MIEIAFGDVGTVLSEMARFRMVELARCVAALWIEFAFDGGVDGRSDGFVVHHGNHMRCCGGVRGKLLKTGGTKQKTKY